MQNLIEFDINNLRENIFHLKIRGTPVLVKNLSAKDYSPFSPDLEFAGVSLRGKPLSIRNSKGPATFNGLPIAITKPDDAWIKIPTFGVLLKTDKPKLCIQVSNSEVHCLVRNTDLIDRFDIFETGRVELPGQLYHQIDLNDALEIYTHYPKANIVIDTYSTNVSISLPADTELPSTTWKQLDRHIFTGKEKAAYSETVRISSLHCNALHTPCSCISDVETIYGIHGTPSSAQNGHLYFTEIFVADAVKASNLHPFFVHLKGMQISFADNYHFWNCFTFESLENNLQIIRDIHPFSLDINKSCAHIRDTANIVSQLKSPLFEHSNKRVLCPVNIIDEYFVQYDELIKKYDLSNVEVFKLISTKSSLSKTKWIRKSDFSTLIPLDHKSIKTSLKEREARLKTLYGALPSKWRQHNDDEIKSYFNIENRLKANEIVSLYSCTLIPKMSNYSALIDWLTKANHLINCPLTRNLYITNFKSVDELAKISGFWNMLEKTIGNSSWIKRLILSKEAQHQAITDFI